MNALKKLFSLCLALMLVLSLAVPALADEEPATYTITISDANRGHEYEAYQIFAGTLLDGSADTDPNTTGLILSDIKWGAGVANKDELLSTLLNDETPITYTSGDNVVTTTLKSVFSSVTGEGDAAAAQIAALLGSNQPVEVVDRFAEVVGYYTNSVHVYLGTPQGTSSAYNEDTKQYTISGSGMTAGYYLVKDKEGTQTGNHDFYTKYMLQVVHSLTVQPKGSIPTVDKETNKTIDGTYTEANSFDINDDVFFKLTGTLPENLEAYTSYKVEFVDTLPKGMSFRELRQIEIVDHDGNVAYVIYDKTQHGDTLPTGVTSSEVTTKEDGTKNWTLTITDLKSLYSALAPDDKIVVKYVAYLNRNAEIDEPNANTVVMNYSNNPSGAGIGTTVDDYAHAFTHKFKVIKKETGSEKKLADVKFLLYFTRSHTGEDGQDVTKTYYAQVITEEMVKDKEEVNGIVVTTADVGVVYGWTEEVAKASVLDTDSNGEFSIRGLDSGTYYLRETETNAGYNLLTNDVRINIAAEYVHVDTLQADVNVTYAVGGSANGSLGEGGASSGLIIIENSKGNTLPTTGGVGTTLFYVIGGALVIGAVVMLITKKRMSSEF